MKENLFIEVIAFLVFSIITISLVSFMVDKDNIKRENILKNCERVCVGSENYYKCCSDCHTWEKRK